MKVTREQWERFNIWEQKEERIEPVVRESWERSKQRGINPQCIPDFLTYTQEELLEAIEKNKMLMVVIEPYVQNVLAIIHEMTGVHIAFLDREGYMLKVWTDGSIEEEAQHYGIFPGVCWSEDVMGTNAPGIAVSLDKSIVIEGYEHYVDSYHHLSCISVPIHHPKGEILGVLNITIPFENYNKSYLGMLVTAVRGIERELSHMEYQRKIEKLNKRLEESVRQEKKLREQLQEKAELLQGIIDNISDGLLIADEEGNYVMDNKEIYNIFGGSKETMKIKHVGDSSKYVRTTQENGEILSIQNNPVNRMLAGEKVENEINMIEGENFKRYTLVNGFTLKDHAGYIKYVITTQRDITALKNRELEMKRQREFMSKVLDIVGAPMGVVKYPDLTYEISNQKNNEMVSHLIGKEESFIDLTGASIIDVGELLESTSFMDKVKLVGESKRELVFEANYHSRTKEYHNSVYSPLMDEEGNVTHVVVVNSDVTNQILYNKKIEEMARQRDEFFSIVSHELRSPTAIINSATQMLLSPYYKGELTPGAEKLVYKVKQNSYRLLRLINNFLDITKIEEGFISINNDNIDIIGLSKAITDSLQFTAANKGIQLKFESKIREKMIALDGDKYERILLNLLSNAFKFTLPNHQISVGIGKVKEYVRISVKDSGIGIPEEKLSSIFNRFVQVNSSLSRTSEGTGIGLSLVKALVEKMEGKLEVTSTEGIGSEFIVFLPDRKVAKEKTTPKPIKSSSEIAEVINVEFSDIYSLA